MNQRELNSLFSYDYRESKLFMPNEIFEDLRNCELILEGSRSSHIAFSYSYVYLITWLYRYAKYEEFKLLKQPFLKSILGYASTNKTLNYLVKEDGVLDKLGYTETMKGDFPVQWHFDKNFDEFISFTMFSEYNDEIKQQMGMKNLRRTQIKYPLKAMEERIFDDGYEIMGTFYEIPYTHMIPFEVFIYCMTNKEVGCEGFYLYCFLKMLNDKYPKGVDISLDDITKDTGIKPTTRDKYLDSLKRFKLINCIVNQDFVIGLPKDERLANTYRTLEYNFFTRESYEYYQKRNVISLQKWGERKNEENDSEQNQLPF